FDVFAGKKSAQIREILISESAWEEMTCLFAPSLKKLQHEINIAKKKVEDGNIESLRESLDKMNDIKLEGHRKFR
ncbi:hypothetical protein ACRW2B_26770, partial [Escherichia coli]